MNCRAFGARLFFARTARHVPRSNFDVVAVGVDQEGAVVAARHPGSRIVASARGQAGSFEAIDHPALEGRRTRLRQGDAGPLSSFQNEGLPATTRNDSGAPVESAGPFHRLQAPAAQGRAGRAPLAIEAGGGMVARKTTPMAVEHVCGLMATLLTRPRRQGAQEPRSSPAAARRRRTGASRSAPQATQYPPVEACVGLVEIERAVDLDLAARAILRPGRP